MKAGYLPAELVSGILEELYFDHRRQPDHRTLSSCSRVCRVWRIPAQRLLFHDVALPGKDREQKLESFRTAAYGTSDHSRLLASYVRRVQVTLSSAEAYQNSDAFDLIDLVSHCRQLYEISLRIQGIHLLDSATLDALRNAHQQAYPTCIRSLRLVSCGTLSPILYQLLSIWSTVQYLRLGTEVAALPPKLPTNVQLYELSMWRTQSPRVLAWLLSASKDTLRVLECHTALDNSYDHVFHEHCGQLRSLRIWRHTYTANVMIRKCTDLQELVIAQPSSFLPLGDLPLSIVHLGFRYFPGATNFPLKPIVSTVDKLPKLRIVSCDTSVRGHIEYASLQGVCEKHNIAICNDVLPLPGGLLDDPVPIVRYPRSRSVQNFSYMNQGVC